MANKKQNIHENIVINDNVNDYCDAIANRYIKTTTKKMEKIDSENLHIPLFHQHEMMTRFNYNLQQLKQIAKHYKLKLSGNKPQLVSRIHGFLFLSNIAIKIQKFARGMIVRKYFSLHGPGFRNRTICINTCDFLTMEPLEEMSFQQFFSFKDHDNFVYGFDLQSMYNLLYKTNGVIKNPYNRHPIPANIVETFRALIRVSRILKIDILTTIKEDDVSNKKAIELKTVALFQNIDLLGNYSNPKWFMDLNRQQLIKMMMELLDIWAYRAPLTLETKRSICPPNGNPFPPLANSILRTIESVDDLRKVVLDTLEKFVNSGINDDSKCLGAFYVLGALTLVNVEAASSLPWLYQAVI